MPAEPDQHAVYLHWNRAKNNGVPHSSCCAKRDGAWKGLLVHMETAPRRIGVLGGTFNPVHAAHIAMAKGVRRLLDLEAGVASQDS
jgi:hypothetical protein